MMMLIQAPIWKPLRCLNCSYMNEAQSVVPAAPDSYSMLSVRHLHFPLFSLPGI